MYTQANTISSETAISTSEKYIMVKGKAVPVLN
jgi:hypothetical protein